MQRLNNKQLAEFCGVQLDTVKLWRSNGCPAEQSTSPGRPLMYDVQEVVRWLISQRKNLRQEASTEPEVDNWSDEKKRWEIEEKKLKVAERRGEILPRVSVEQCLDRVASILRATGEIFQRQFGADARLVLEEALDRVQRQIDDCCSIGTSDTGGGLESRRAPFDECATDQGEQDKAPADDQSVG